MRHAIPMPTETNSTLSAIRTQGFEQALLSAFQKAMLAKSKIEEARRYLRLSRSFLTEARSFNHSPILFERFLELSSFYRKLAHKVFAVAKKEGETDPVFLQEV